MLAWKFLTGPRTDGPDTELTAATGRQVTVRVGQPSDTSFNLDGRHEQAAGIVELTTDLWCWRGQELLHRGRVGASTDEITSDAHACTFNAPDYRALLDRRFLHDTDKLTYPGEDQASIAWQVVQATQAKAGGSLGVTRGTGQTTGYLRDRFYPGGTPIGEAINGLGDLADGFDWEIDPQLRLNVFTPQRGRDTDVVLDFGGMVTTVSRAFSPSDYANSVRAVAAVNPQAPQYREATNIGVRPEGRFELERGFPDIYESGTLSARADALLADAQVLRPSYTLTLAADRYPGTEELWVGDSVIVRVRSGRLNIADRLRVEAINFTPGEDGQETVRVTVGHPNPAGQFASRLRKTDARLAVLERRTP